LGSWMTSPWHRRNFFVTLGCLLFYIFASNDLGFIPCAIIVLAAMFWALDVRPVLILPVAVGMTLLVHLIFYKGLRVPLPWGILLPWQW
jgi:putative tricarboxylic transport membrane protein